MGRTISSPQEFTVVAGLILHLLPARTGPTVATGGGFGTGRIGNIQHDAVNVQPLALEVGCGIGALALVTGGEDDREIVLAELAADLEADALVCSPQQSGLFGEQK
jgi:hypothetical protein